MSPDVHLQREVLGHAADRGFDRIGIGGTERVGVPGPGGVADQHDGTPGLVALDRVLLRHRLGEVHVLRALEHVRTRGHQVAAVVGVVALGHAEASLGVVGVRRDRRRGRHRQPVPEVAGRTRHRDLQGVIVHGLHAADLVGLTGRELVESVDHRVVEGVPTDVGRRGGLAFHRAHEVLRRDLDLLDRRGVMQARLDRERPREPVGRDLRVGGREVGLHDTAALGGRLAVVAHQRPQQATAVVLPRDAVVLLLRIERARHVRDERDPQRPTGRGFAIRARRALGRGRARIAAARCRHEREREQRGGHPQGSAAHGTPLSPATVVALSRCYG